MRTRIGAAAGGHAVAATGVAMARGAGVVVAGAGADRSSSSRSRPPQQNDFGGRCLVGAAASTVSVYGG